MKKKLTLSFEYNPYSIMYHHIAFPMGIIQGNAQTDITPWLCGKYINCSFAKDKNSQNRFTIYTSDIWAVEDYILMRQQIVLYPELYYLLFDDEVMHLRRMISMGYYPSGLYNEEHIPGKWAYQNGYHRHDFIIIGYDDVSKEFISSSYLRNGKFQKHTIPYDNMRMAIRTLKRETIELFFWKYNREAKFELNLDRVVSELSDYLNSTMSKIIVSDDKYWGIEAMRQLILLYSDSCNSNLPIDIRYSRGFMEHKFYMHMRIEYLFNNAYLKAPTYVDTSKNIYKMSEKIHMLVLKYNITGNKSIVSNIQKMMNDIISIENDYLPSVLSELQNQ